MGSTMLRALLLAVCVASLAAASSEDARVPPLVEELSQETLFTQQTELYDELVQEQDDPILNDSDNHSRGEEGGDKAIVTDDDGVVDNGKDSFLHGIGNGFPLNGYKSREGSNPDAGKTVEGTDSYHNAILGDAKIRKPVYKDGRKGEDAIITNKKYSPLGHEQKPDKILTPPSDGGVSDHDFSEKAIKEMDDDDAKMSEKEEKQDEEGDHEEGEEGDDKKPGGYRKALDELRKPPAK